MKKSKKSTEDTTKTTNKNHNNNNNNTKFFLNLIYLFLVLGLLVFVLFSYDRTQTNQVEERSYTDLVTDIREGKISKIELLESKDKFEVEVYTDLENKNREKIETRTYKNISPNPNISAIENFKNVLGDDLKIGNAEGQIIYTEESKSILTQVLQSQQLGIFLWLVIIIVMAVILIRKIGDINSKSISFGNTRAKAFDEMNVKDKVSFKDVAGNEESKQELSEIVDFLKRPEEYTKMGAKIPHGVLLVGSPGHGKTLMAKAVAGEAGVPFLYVSGSEFVEMFVGVGAGRVRDLFKKAKKKTPCLIFIDEIDAVGRQRGSGLGNGNDEREQTLNQILVEMDGFEDNASVIVLGATNRPDVLDPALLRPGRFDRQITVTAPDRKERLKILEVHAKNKKLDPEADLSIVAKRTPGFSGADLMNVLNEAAILTVREGKKRIDNEALRESIEKVILGPSLKSKIVTPDQKKLTAYHEAGHALVATVLPQASKVQKVTIIPRGRAAGYTFNDINDGDSLTRKKSQFLADITVLFGGYVVEKEIIGELSTGASNDLHKATDMARDMVVKYGMSSLGPVSYDNDRGLSYLGRDMMQTKSYSENSATLIDEEVRKILTACQKNCVYVIKKYREKLTQIAEFLIENEVVEKEEFEKITKSLFNIENKLITA